MRVLLSSYWSVGVFICWWDGRLVLVLVFPAWPGLAGGGCCCSTTRMGSDLSDQTGPQFWRNPEQQQQYSYLRPGLVMWRDNKILSSGSWLVNKTRQDKTRWLVLPGPANLSSFHVYCLRKISCKYWTFLSLITPAYYLNIGVESKNPKLFPKFAIQAGLVLGWAKNPILRRSQWRLEMHRIVLWRLKTSHGLASQK